MNAPQLTSPWPADDELLRIGRLKWAQDHKHCTEVKFLAAWDQVNKTIGTLSKCPMPEDALCALLVHDVIALRTTNADRAAAVEALAQITADPEVEHV